MRGWWWRHFQGDKKKSGKEKKMDVGSLLHDKSERTRRTETRGGCYQREIDIA